MSDETRFLRSDVVIEQLMDGFDGWLRTVRNPAAGRSASSSPPSSETELPGGRVQRCEVEPVALLSRSGLVDLGQHE